MRAEIAYRPRRQLVVHAVGRGAARAAILQLLSEPARQLQRAADEGRLLRAYGEVRSGLFGAEMVHPRYRIVREGEPLATALTPVYPTTAGVSSGAAARARQRGARARAPRGHAAGGDAPSASRCRRSTRACARCTSPRRRRTAQRSSSARIRPGSASSSTSCSRSSCRCAWPIARAAARAAPALPATARCSPRCVRGCPSRSRARSSARSAKMLADLAQPHPMQRLLQGDVGSGKTIVAALACLAAVDGGWQSAVMAPTEILAEQHLRKFSEWLAPLGVQIAWLQGGQPARERRAMRAALEAGEATIAIGTHALFQEGVKFARLGLAVVDEQHRFGVEQRLLLRRKAERRRAAPADDERHADPAHAVDELLRRPRRLGDRRAAARPPPGEDPPGRRGAARRGAGAHPGRLHGGPAGLLGVPGHRGVQRGHAADRARHLRDADARASPACRSGCCTAACRPARRRRRWPPSPRGARSCWSRPR